jgi:hypothetical protein
MPLAAVAARIKYAASWMGDLGSLSVCGRRGKPRLYTKIEAKRPDLRDYPSMAKGWNVATFFTSVLPNHAGKPSTQIH